jgi:ATP-binding cassette, subfamily B, bacterial PglK
MTETLHRLVSLLRLMPARSRWILAAIVPALVLNSIFEVATISLLMPFVQELTGKASTTAFRWFTIYDWLAVHVVPTNRLLSVGVSLVALFVLKNMYQALVWYGVYRFVQMRAAATSAELFREYLHRPYEFHLETNSSVLISHITQQVQHVFSSILLPLLYLGTELVTVLLLLAVMFRTAALATAITLMLVLLVGVTMTKILRPIIQRNARKHLREEAMIIRWVSQGLGAFKEIKVLGKEDFVVKQFSLSATEYGRSLFWNTFIAKIPRLVAEPTVLAILVIFLAVATQRGGGPAAIGSLALFGAASLRLIPSFTTFNTMINKIRFSLPALEMVTTELRTPSVGRRRDNGPHDLLFSRSLHVNHVTHQYPGANRPALIDVSFRLAPGEHIAIMGPSGSGKTTLVSILLGLLEPTEGTVSVDDKSIDSNVPAWHRSIGYVPQDMFLLDDTIRNNICLGIPDSDEVNARLSEVLEICVLSDFVRTLPNQIHTQIGERGVQISGGQRQRIGLARALFRAPKLLILDEATSGLDRATERAVLQNIFQSEPTLGVILVTHRVEVAAQCEEVFEIAGGRLARSSCIVQRT